MNQCLAMRGAGGLLPLWGQPLDSSGFTADCAWAHRSSQGQELWAIGALPESRSRFPQ